MKYIITESRLQGLIENYLDTKDWVEWDIGDGEFNLADGKYGKDLIRFRLLKSVIDGLYFDIIYLNDDFVSKIRKLFSISSDRDAIIIIINWFNKKYDKNLTIDNFEWMDTEDEEYDD
jgi:hypothetical protein